MTIILVVEKVVEVVVLVTKLGFTRHLIFGLRSQAMMSFGQHVS